MTTADASTPEPLALLVGDFISTVQIWCSHPFNPSSGEFTRYYFQQLDSSCLRQLPTYNSIGLQVPKGASPFSFCLDELQLLAPPVAGEQAVPVP